VIVILNLEADLRGRILRKGFLGFDVLSTL
jgi:hypothetical protein